jgi:stage V sporulation protein B
MASATTARGTILLSFAKAIFLAGSLIIHIFLGRTLGPADYGQYGLVMSILLWFEVIVNSAVPWAVAKVVSEERSSAARAFRQGMICQLVFSLFVLVLFLILSPAMARAFGDRAMKILLWWAAMDIPLFALLSVYLTYFNGLQQFGRQGLVTIGRIVFKVVATVALVLGGFSVQGALVANILASLLALLLGAVLLRRPPLSPEPVRLLDRVLDFGVPFTLFLLSAQLLMSVDLWLVKILVPEASAAGFYTSAQTVSRVPYFLFLGLSTALFPALSQSISSGRVDISRIQIRQAMRLMALVLLPAGAIVSSSSRAVVGLLFGANFSPAILSLSVLIWGMILYTVFYNLAVILSVAGRPVAALLYSLALAALGGLLCWMLVPVWGLAGAAAATTIVSLAGMVILGVLVQRQFGPLIEGRAMAKMVVVSAIIFGVSLLVPLGGVLFLFKSVVLFVLFVGGMVLVKEMGRGDLERLKALWPSIG